MKKQFMNEFIMHSGNEIMKQQQTQNFKTDGGHSVQQRRKHEIVPAADWFPYVV